MRNASNSLLERGFKAKAERISLECRKEMGLKEYDPMPALALAEFFNIQILIPKDIPGITAELTQLLLGSGKNYWSAAIYIKDDKKYIIHNPTHSLPRQESNLMHECAHAILDHELSSIETALNGCIIPLRNYNNSQEAQAECLGACLQLPKTALFHYHHILRKSTSEISQIFNASKAMVQYRLRITGVLKVKYRK